MPRHKPRPVPKEKGKEFVLMSYQSYVYGELNASLFDRAEVVGPEGQILVDVSLLTEAEDRADVAEARLDVLREQVTSLKKEQQRLHQLNESLVITNDTLHRELERQEYQPEKDYSNMLFGPIKDRKPFELGEEELKKLAEFTDEYESEFSQLTAEHLHGPADNTDNTDNTDLQTKYDELAAKQAANSRVLNELFKTLDEVFGGGPSHIKAMLPDFANVGDNRIAAIKKLAAAYKNSEQQRLYFKRYAVDEHFSRSEEILRESFVDVPDDGYSKTGGLMLLENHIKQLINRCNEYKQRIEQYEAVESEAAAASAQDVHSGGSTTTPDGNQKHSGSCRSAQEAGCGGELGGRNTSADAAESTGGNKNADEGYGEVIRLIRELVVDLIKQLNESTENLAQYRGMFKRIAELPRYEPTVSAGFWIRTDVRMIESKRGEYVICKDLFAVFDQ